MSAASPSGGASGDFRPALNALRAAASVWVVIYHFRYYSDYPWFDLFAVKNGYLGVDVFFVLSGLVISHVYLKSALGGYGLTEHLRFLWLRIARLWPVHAALMLAMLAGALAGGKQLTSASLFDWFSLTFLFRQWLFPEGYAWNSPAWSISAEFFAYALVFPVVVACARSMDFKRAARILILPGLALYATMELTFGTINVTQYFGPILRVIAGFSLGAGIYCLVNKITPSEQWDKLVWLGLVLFFASLFGNSDMMSILSFCVVLVGLYLATGKTAQAFSIKPLYHLGEWSFALYLIHIPAFRLGKYVADLADFHRGPVFCLIILGLSILGAAFTYHFLETPARKYLRGLPPVSRGVASRSAT